MWEFEVMDIETGEIFFIYGYSILDACRREDIFIEEIEVLTQTYVD